MTEADGSGTALTIRQLLLEMREDMQFVRPAVKALVDADLVTRIGRLESKGVGIAAVVHTLGAVKAFLLLSFAAIGAAATLFSWLHL